MERARGHKQSKKTDRNRPNKWTGEDRQKMFENVLKFPKGTDHLKYFDKNPHPDRIPDKELAIYEAFNQARKNAGKIDAHKTDFEIVRKYLQPRLSEFEKKLLTLPDILQN